MHLAAGSDYMQCEFCKNIHIADPDDEGVRVTEEESALSCPICNLPLKNATLMGIRLQSCTKCRGMLIPMGTFVDLIEQLKSKQGDAVAIPTRAAAEELRRKINCPKCHHPMDAHFYLGGGSVVIDGCDDCCLNWLDHGELMRIVRAPD
jgi:Zn-finger nucleic acid-binding protein